MKGGLLLLFLLLWTQAQGYVCHVLWSIPKGRYAHLSIMCMCPGLLLCGCGLIQVTTALCVVSVTLTRTMAARWLCCLLLLFLLFLFFFLLLFLFLIVNLLFAITDGEVLLIFLLLLFFLFLLLLFLLLLLFSSSSSSSSSFFYSSSSLFNLLFAVTDGAVLSM